MGVMNMSLSAYKDSGTPSFYISSAKVLFVGGQLLPILKTGFGQPLSPVIVLAGSKVHIATPDCASVGAGAFHMEGSVPVLDYSSYSVQSDTGTLFIVKPSWLTHFLGVIGFAPIPIPPIS
jgi:hypothetical protein